MLHPFRTSPLHCVLLTALVILTPAFAAAQTLTVSNGSGLPGAAVDLTVSLSGASNISTLQFDLAFPASLTGSSTGVTAGSAATTAGKSVGASVVSGGMRVVIFGLNQNVIPTGTLAVVRLTISAGASPGQIPVAVTNIVASDPTEHAVTVSERNGTVTVNAPADTTPPTISAVGASAITSSGATISWTTNEASNTQVDYGTTTAYSSSTTLSTAMVTAHTQTLSGLSASSLYHYRVKSRDAAGNLSTSNDFTFTTAAAPDNTPPVITGVAVSEISSTGARISWNTDETSDTQVEYGETTAYGSSTAVRSSPVRAHTQDLGGLSPETAYHFRVKSRDAAGNLAVSGDFTFTTAGESDTTPPVITSVTASGQTATTVLITWATDEDSDTQVEYGQTTGYGNSTAKSTARVRTHTVLVSGLDPATTYHYRARSSDAAGNPAVSGDFTFTTTSENDTAPPVISSVSATPTATGATVRWTTNEPADSQVEFGTTSSYDKATPLNAASVTVHSQTLEGLTPATTYHFRVKSKDAEGNAAVSGDFTFTTSEKDADDTAPEITSVRVTAIGRSGATISWTTDEPADGQVEYGELPSYGSQTRLNTASVTQHSEILTGLKAGTQYHFRVTSKDVAGNKALSEDHTFTTSQKEETKLTLSYPRPHPRRPGAAQMGESDYIGVAIANLDTRAATLTFTAYDSAGRQIEGPGLTNPVERVLDPAHQLPIVDDQLFGDSIHSVGGTGWIRVESTSSKVAGFFLTFNSEMNVLDGANICGTATNSFVLPEIEDQGFTRVNIANPNAEPVQLTFELMRSNGTLRVSASRVISAWGAFGADLFADLFPDTLPVASDYVRVRASNGVLPFALFGKEGEYLEGLNGQSNMSASQTLYSPQYAVGGSWRSALSVVNLDGAPGTVTFRFIRDDASQIGATKVLPIDAYGKIYIDDPAFFQSLFVNPTNVVTQGYIELISSGVRLVGSVVFGDPDRKRFSSALPLVTQLQTSVTFSQVSSNDHYFTGIAMLNPGTTDTFATIELYGPDGAREAMTTIPLLARQRKSLLLTELFPSLVGQDRTAGYFKVMSDREIAAFALFGSHDLSVLSAVPPQ